MRHRVMGTALPLLSPRLLDRKDAASRSIDKRLLLKGEQTCKGHDGRLQPGNWAEALKAIEACVVLNNASRTGAIAGDLAPFEEI